MLLGIPLSAPQIIAPVQVVEAASVTKHDWTKAELEKLVADTAREHHLDVHQFVETARCESSNFIDPAIQSGFTGNDGKQEQSFGIFQINVPSHADVTRAQAQDPVFASEWAATKWEEGQQSIWSCWRHKFGK